MLELYMYWLSEFKLFMIQEQEKGIESYLNNLTD